MLMDGTPPPSDCTGIEGYAGVECIFYHQCSFRPCHSNAFGHGGMNFEGLFQEGIPYTEVLVDVPSCGYDAMPRVTPGDPSQSYLMIKIAGPADDDGQLIFEPDPSWDHGLELNADGTFPPSRCPLVQTGELTFGAVMPLPPRFGPIERLAEDEIEVIRQWILDGAPGPDE